MSGAAAAGRFEAVYRAEARGLWRFLYRLGVRGSLTDDLTQQTFLVAFGRWQQLDPSRPVGPWLRGIAWRVAADHRRLHVHHEVSTEQLPEVEARAPGADEQLASRRALGALERGLDGLNAEQRAVFVMHELEGISIADIAVEMDSPVPTIYSRLRLARERLSALLEAHRKGASP